jgi:hypothetical protein
MEVRFDNVIKLMNKYGAEVVSEMLTRLNGFKKNASGELQKSLKYDIDQNGDVISLVIEGVDYAKYVDKGRRPGKYAPVSALKKWAKIKGIPEKAVYAINRSIFKKGIAPTNFMTTTLTRRKSKFEELVAEAYKKDVELYLEWMTKELNKQ